MRAVAAMVEPAMPARKPERRSARPLLLALPVIVLPAVAMLAGCGQTGDLYFTGDPPADQLPPSLKRDGSPIPSTVGGASAAAPETAATSAAAANPDAAETEKKPPAAPN